MPKRLQPRKMPRRTPVVPLQGTVLVSRRVYFNAAHRLENPGFSARWNEKVFGECNSRNWHGHNYVLEVSVKGEPDPDTGFVIDFKELKRILETEIVEKCDHRNLNEDVPFLKGIIPSTENLVIAFWNRLESKIGSGKLYRVRLYETDRNFAEYYGPHFS